MLLFTDACEISVTIRPNSRSYYNMEQMDKGIVPLQKAIRFSLLSPHLYLKLAHYLLYTA